MGHLNHLGLSHLRKTLELLWVPLVKLKVLVLKLHHQPDILVLMVVLVLVVLQVVVVVLKIRHQPVLV
jgi:hypothetical protein